MITGLDLVQEHRIAAGRNSVSQDTSPFRYAIGAGSTPEPQNIRAVAGLVDAVHVPGIRRPVDSALYAGYRIPLADNLIGSHRLRQDADQWMRARALANMSSGRGNRIPLFPDPSWTPNVAMVATFTGLMKFRPRIILPR
jgi:hypothetical protein